MASTKSEVKVNASAPSRRGESADSQRLIYNKKTNEMKNQISALTSLMLKAETKRPIPAFQGTTAPTRLEPPWLGYEFVDTRESQLLKTALSRMFAKKQYGFRLATALNMSSSGAGIVNSIIQNTILAANTDFSSLSSVFNEFFVERFDVLWEPVSLNNFPLTGLPDGKTVSSLPMGAADLQHNAPAYTSMAGMTENFRYKHTNTGRAFQYSWLNTESRGSTVLPQATGELTQAWCLTSAASTYQGTLQFLTQSAPPGLPVSSVLGTFLVEHLVYFRVRE